MHKPPDPTLHKTTRTEITSLFGEAKLVLDETPKAISPFGGLANFIFLLGQIGFARQVEQHLLFAEPTSNTLQQFQNGPKSLAWSCPAMFPVFESSQTYAKFCG